jgi:hypothetical protein
MSKPYDKGDESGSVATLADAATTDTPVSGLAYLAGVTPTWVSIANGLPVQPATGSTWVVSDGGGSLTVDGTVAVTGTFWQATQPVSLASVPLASDAATATLQTAQGVVLASIDSRLAGSLAVSGPLTDAQLRATAVPVSLTSTTITGTVAATQSGTWTVGLSAGSNAVGTVTAVGAAAHDAAASGNPVLIGGYASDSSTSGVSDGDVSWLRLDSQGRLIISPNYTLSVSGYVDIRAYDVVTESAISLAATGLGDSGVLWSNLHASDGTEIASATTTPGASDLGLVVRPAGTSLVSGQAATSGGYSAYTFLSTAAVQTAQIKGSAGQVYKVSFFNNTATIAYVRLYNQTGAPGSGDAANIIWRGMIPASTSGAGWVESFPDGLTFSTGIGVRVTAAVADNDTTALAANAVLGSVAYK